MGHHEESSCHCHSGSQGCGCCSGHDHEHNHESKWWKAYTAPAISFVMLIAGVLMSHFGFTPFTSARWVEYCWYVAAFLPVGFPVVKEALEGVAKRDFFNEFTLMVIASIGAF